MKWNVLWITLVISVVASPTLAADREFAPACREDFERFCSELDPESSRKEIRRCLEERRGDLSDTCREALAENGDAKRSCQEQIQELCPAASDRRARRQCLQERKEELSPECQGQADKKRGGRGGRRGGRGGL